MRQFNNMVSKKLGHYVYALLDPTIKGNLKDQIFYVGKGQHSRCFNHAARKRGKLDDPLHEHEHKLARIRAIEKKQCKVGIRIIQHGMELSDAFALESVLIPLVGLTNRVSGHRNESYWLSENSVAELYDKPVLRSDVPELFKCILVVSLNQQSIEKLESNDSEMERACLGDWAISETNSRCVDYIIGAQQGLVVSVFEINKRPSGDAEFDRIQGGEPRKHGRSRFYGKRRADIESKIVERTVLYKNTPMTSFPKRRSWNLFAAINY